MWQRAESGTRAHARLSERRTPRRRRCLLRRDAYGSRITLGCFFIFHFLSDVWLSLLPRGFDLLGLTQVIMPTVPYSAMWDVKGIEG